MTALPGVFVPTPLVYFSTLVGNDDELPLLEAAVSLAQDEAPDLDVQQTLTEVDLWLATLKRRVPGDADGLARLRLLNQYFYRELGFSGNLNDYYNPANSYLDAVVATRRGIPISLAVLWLELAQGLGLRAHGVAFPGHFMVKVNLPKGQVVMDPLTGQSLSREDLLERLEPYRARGSDPQAVGERGGETNHEPPLALYLQGASARDILARMLRNLKEIHRTQEDWPRLLRVLNRLVVLLPESWGEWRDRGLVYAEVGQYRQAAADLQTYVDHADGEPDVTAIRARLAGLLRTP